MRFTLRPTLRGVPTDYFLLGFLVSTTTDYIILFNLQYYSYLLTLHTQNIYLSHSNVFDFRRPCKLVTLYTLAALGFFIKAGQLEARIYLSRPSYTIITWSKWERIKRDLSLNYPPPLPTLSKCLCIFLKKNLFNIKFNLLHI